LQTVRGQGYFMLGFISLGPPITNAVQINHKSHMLGHVDPYDPYRYVVECGLE